MSPTPIETAPDDTARAMHAAEMRGSDMQDVIKSRITDEDMHESGRYFMDYFRDVTSCSHGDTGDYNNPHDGRMISELWNAHRAGKLITEAECQRRVDAAVQAERDACAKVQIRKTAPNGLDYWAVFVWRRGWKSAMKHKNAAIRARGQK